MSEHPCYDDACVLGDYHAGACRIVRDIVDRLRRFHRSFVIGDGPSLVLEAADEIDSE